MIDICSGNSHMVDAIRMQMEVQRRLHEQLEVKKLCHSKYFLTIEFYNGKLMNINT